MTRWCIAIVLCAALLLVGTTGAVKPAQDPVDRIVLIHYKDGLAAKPAPVPDAASFKLLGIKWKTTSPVLYRVSPSNDDTSDDAGTAASVAASFATWDAATSKGLFTGGGAPTKEIAAALNGENLVFWQSMPESNIIARTSIWYNRATKAIVETDITMNDNDQYGMVWGIDPDGEAGTVLEGAYDIQNIVTHEVGHVCGLGDLYTTGARELTMYGYGSHGETKKRSLAPGDIAGLVKLYGA